MNEKISGFSSVWIVIVHNHRAPGEPASPGLLAAREIQSSEAVQIGAPKLLSERLPPYATGPQSLFVTFGGDELGALNLALGWRMPERLIDLAVEFRNLTNGRSTRCGNGLVGALTWFGLSSASALSQVQTPVAFRRRLEAVSQLFRAMLSELDLPRALLRGRYMLAVARIEVLGVPIDTELLCKLVQRRTSWRTSLLMEVDKDFGFYHGSVFQLGRFEQWLTKEGIVWPTTVHGVIDLSDSTFREMARIHPVLMPLKALRSVLAGADPGSAKIGSDGRNRAQLNPFAARTGRNQPSTKDALICGPSWMRGLVRPSPGNGLAFIDWCSQEFGIAAALSGDCKMQAAYAAGDPYLALARGQSRSVAATRATYKAVALGVQYGMGSSTLARYLGVPKSQAQEFIDHHKRLFPQFWKWIEAVDADALCRREQNSVFGWRVSVVANTTSGAIRNFPMQTNGAEILRLACCLTTEAGIRVCAPLHDALLIEAKLSDLDDAIADTQRLMAEASAIVLDGFALRTDVRTARYPTCLDDVHSSAIWPRIKAALTTEARLPRSALPHEAPAHQRGET